MGEAAHDTRYDIVGTSFSTEDNDKCWCHVGMALIIVKGTMSERWLGLGYNFLLDGEVIKRALVYNLSQILTIHILIALHTEVQHIFHKSVFLHEGKMRFIIHP